MRDDLDDRLLSSIRKVAFAEHRFEPFPRTVVGESTLHRLVEAGLVETGRSCRPAVGTVGYRLTGKGWQIARERWTSREAEFAL